MAEEMKLVAGWSKEVSPSLRDLFAVIFRQRRLLVASFILTFLCVFLYGLAEPQYKSEMKVLVRRGRVDPAIAPTPSQAELVHAEVSEEDLNSEVELLRDDEILRTVARNLRLNGRRMWLHPWDNEEERTARAAKRLQKQLRVEPVRKTSLVDVTYVDSDKDQPRNILRAITAAYLERHTQVRRPSGEATFFEHQVLEARQALEQAQLRAVKFSKENGVVSADYERDARLRQLSDVEADEQQSRVAVAAALERIRALQSQIEQLPERSVTLVKESDNPELMQKMKSQLLDLELSRTELLAKYEPTYRSVRDIDERIAETKSEIDKEEHSPIREQASDRDANHEWVKSELLRDDIELKGLRAHTAAEGELIQRYRASARLLGERAIQQQQLLDDMKEAEQKYLLYVNKREEARIGDALDQGGILNVAIAEQPTTPALPQWSALSFSAFGLLIGGVVSFGSAFANDYLSSAFRTPDEVVAYLGTPVLACLPSHGTRRLGESR